MAPQKQCGDFICLVHCMEYGNYHTPFLFYMLMLLNIRA
nr:MAG TPA: hypothetical protein [Caudoviricetes sp.]